MQAFERIYTRTLRHLYDTEKQLFVSLPGLRTDSLDPRLAELLVEIAAQSKRQLDRLEGVFRVLYQEPRAEASWVTTALLREAYEAATGDDTDAATEGCAAALLALKRYELTLYETLLRWSEQCELLEVLPAIRRSLAEELLHASVLSGLAFEVRAEPAATIEAPDRRALH